MPEKESKDLDDIKRLLILLLYKLGSTLEEIALALDVDQSAVSRMIPSRRIKRIVKPLE